MKQVLLFALILTMVYCENIVRHQCGREAAFYKIASNHALSDANTITKATSLGLIGCINLCVRNETCKAFNYKSVTRDESLCELLPHDRNTKPTDVLPRPNWHYYDTGLFSSQIGQHCNSLSYNPCYPCLCIDSCYEELKFSCNVTAESPPLPDIYAGFEKTLENDATKTAYDRGEDASGNAVIRLLNGASVAVSATRPGKVLKIAGTNAGAVVGNFQDTPINNPAQTRLSISLWLRFLSTVSGYQTVLGSGLPGSNTGILVRVHDSARRIYARSILSNKHMLTPKAVVGDTLQTWSHIVFTCNWASQELILYVNGRAVTRQTNAVATSVSTTGHPNLIFGAGSLLSLVNDHWNMHMDDFTVWMDHILTPAEVIYVMNKGFV